MGFRLDSPWPMTRIGLDICFFHCWWSSLTQYNCHNAFLWQCNVRGLSLLNISHCWASLLTVRSGSFPDFYEMAHIAGRGYLNLRASVVGIFSCIASCQCRARNWAAYLQGFYEWRIFSYISPYEETCWFLKFAYILATF